MTTGELSKITGTDSSGDNAWQKFWSWIKDLDSIHGTTLLVGGLSLICLFGLRAVAPRVPGALVVVVAGLVASAVLGLGDRGVPSSGMSPGPSLGDYSRH